SSSTSTPSFFVALTRLMRRLLPTYGSKFTRHHVLELDMVVSVPMGKWVLTRCGPPRNPGTARAFLMSAKSSFAARPLTSGELELGALPHADEHAPSSSERLDDDRHSLSDADAQRGDPIPPAPRAKRVHEVDQDPRPAHPQGMPDGDGAAVHVDALRVDAQFADHRERLRREGLVQLHEVEVPYLQSGPLQRLARRG